MCESEAYIIHKGTKVPEKFMDEVVFVNVEGNKISLSKMFGEQKKLNDYKIAAIDLLNHRIIIEKI